MVAKRFSVIYALSFAENFIKFRKLPSIPNFYLFIYLLYVILKNLKWVLKFSEVYYSVGKCQRTEFLTSFQLMLMPFIQGTHFKT